MIRPNILTKHLDKLSIPAVYDLLVGLGCARETVYLRGQLVWLKDFAQDDPGQLAGQTEVVLFWGGPPTHPAYYKGTLYTLLIDRIYNYLCSHTLEDLKRVMGYPYQRVFQW